MRYRILNLEARDKKTMEDAINALVTDDEQVISASFGSVEHGPDEWPTTFMTVTLLIGKRPQPPMQTLPPYIGSGVTGFPSGRVLTPEETPSSYPGEPDCPCGAGRPCGGPHNCAMM